MSQRILVLGGYGIFGKRICRYLARRSDVTIIIAGRHLEQAEKLKQNLLLEFKQAQIETMMMDVEAIDFKAKLEQVKPFCLVHTAGPFQGMSYFVPRLCIEMGIHYVDIADGRSYVVDINTLDEIAKQNNVVVISGASSLPGLTTAVVAHFAPSFSALLEVEMSISPGNKIERGDAVVKAILDYTGKPFIRLENGSWKTRYGWQDCHRRYYGDNLGLRWHASCDVPDLDLLPQQYPSLKTVSFFAGLEVTSMHLLMWMMSWLTRFKIISKWRKFQRPIIAMSRWFKNKGTDTGGMIIRMYGTNHRYQPLEIVWTLIAEQGDGPNIPIVSCVLIVEKLLKGELDPGARACVALYELAEFEKVIEAWHIYYHVEKVEM